MLQHRHKEIAQRLVVVGLEGVMLAVVEAATGEDDGEVCVVVLVGVAHVAAEEHHRAVEQAGFVFTFRGKAFDQFAQQHHLLAVGVFELFHFGRSLAMMTEAVVAFRGVFAIVNLERGRGKSIDHERDDARGVGLEGQLRHGEHEIELFKDQLLVLDVRGLRPRGDGLGLQFPLTRREQPLLHLAHGGEVLIETRSVIAPKAAAQLLRVI